MSAEPKRIDRYELVDRLGQGGMGTLYLARDPALGRTVAIKLLSVRSAELRERFEREARAAAALKHHNIVTIYDVGEEDGQPFIAMEFVAGETLAEIVGRRAPLSPLRKIELLEELCAGLGYAHRAGVVHRDIKPANLMVSAEGPLKILDFGLARVLTGPTQPELTRAGVMVGTPHYMSPEQIEGRAIDHRSDIFSVGLVIYELLSYQRAYPGDSPYGVVHRVLTSEPEPLERVSPGIDPALPAIVNRAIEKDPANRYQDLASLGADLSRVRQRLGRAASEPTIVSPALAGPGAKAGAATPSPSPSPRALDREALTRRRALEIQRHLDAGLGHMTAGRFEQAIEACEAAALIDPDDERVLSLLRQAQDGMVDRQVAVLVGQAQEALERGTLSRADVLLSEAEQLRPDARDVQALRQDVDKARLERERLAERARAVRAALDRAAASLGQGALESALRSISEALAHDPLHAEARALKQRVLDAIDARGREEELERRALEQVAQARRLFGDGDDQGAIDLLESFTPPHPVVDRARDELIVERDALVRRAREAEELERHRAAEAARMQADAERLTRAQQEALRRAEQEEQARREKAEHERRRIGGVHKAAAVTAIEARRYDDALAALAESRAAWPGDPELAGLEDRALAGRAAAEAAAQRQQSVEQTLTAAEAARAAGDLARARRLVDAALEADPASSRATALKSTLERAMTARREQQALESRVQDAIAAARQRFQGGQTAEAIEALAGFTPAHPAVTRALAELREQLEAMERARLVRERAEESARQARAEAEARQREEARRERAAALVASARRQLAAGDLAAARAEAAEALLLWPAHDEALAVRELVEKASRERRDREQHDALATKAIDRAQELVGAGQPDDAIRTLEAFSPPHPAVTAALAALRGSAAATRVESVPAPAPPPATTRRLLPLALVASVVLLAAIGAGGWWWMRHASTGSTRPPEQKPEQSKEHRADEGVAAVATARSLKAETRARDAVAALRGHEDATGAHDVITELYADAARDAESAAREARDGGVADTALADAQQALERGRGAASTLDGVTALLDARDGFRAALARATAPDAVVTQARTAFESGDVDRALQLAGSVESRDPSNVALGALTTDMQRTEERRALEQRRKAERSSGSGTAEFQAAVRAADTARRTPGLAGVRAWRQATEAFTTAAARPVEPSSPYARLDDLVRRGNDDAALREAQQLLARSPADAHATQVVGVLRQRAAASAAAARNDAQAAGARAQWPPEMSEALRHESRAQAQGATAADSTQAWMAARQAYARAAATAREASRTADQVAALWQRGQRDDAITQLEAGLKAYPGYSRLDELLGTAFDAAVRETEAEAAKARRGNAAGTAAYRAALADEQQGRRNGRSIEGVRAFARAAQGYQQALAASPAGDTAAGGGKSSTSPAAMSPDVVRREVDAVLQSIARAYEAKDIDEINRLLRDTMQYNQLKEIERNFKETKSIRFSLALARLEIQPDGIVRATCTQTREIRPKAGSSFSDSRTTVLTMRKSGDEWRVLSQAYP